jgi:hypothetical protein
MGNRTIAAVVVTAVVVVCLMFLGLRYGGHLTGSSHDEAADDTSNASTQDQSQPQPPQFPKMELQGQFAGPLKGTMIQRWRDPVDGTICYIYLPMVVHHKPAPSGYVEYGSNTIGSISCIREAAAK